MQVEDLLHWMLKQGSSQLSVDYVPETQGARIELSVSPPIDDVGGFRYIGAVVIKSAQFPVLTHNLELLMEKRNAEG